MSTRPHISPQIVINSGDMSQASLTSAVTILQKLSMVTYSYVWSGSSPVGTIIVQVSNDYALNSNGSVSNAGTWNTIPFLSSTGSIVTSFAVSGNSGNGMVDVTTGSFAIRTVYTQSSGTGSLIVILNSKVS